MAKEKVKVSSGEVGNLEEALSPVTNPPHKFSVGQEVSVEGGSRGKVLSIDEDGEYTVSQSTTVKVPEKKIAAV
jgi:dsDNA-specific endonuclease/ATPase MutS2